VINQDKKNLIKCSLLSKQFLLGKFKLLDFAISLNVFKNIVLNNDALFQSFYKYFIIFNAENNEFPFQKLSYFY
jgi:hypothetical protein